MYKHTEYQLITERMKEPRRFILFNPQSAFIVGNGGISAEDFLSMDLRTLF